MKFYESIMRFVRIAVIGVGAVAGGQAIGSDELPATQSGIILTLVVAALTGLEKFFRDNQLLWGKLFPSKESKTPPTQ